MGISGCLFSPLLGMAPLYGDLMHQGMPLLPALGDGPAARSAEDEADDSFPRFWGCPLAECVLADHIASFPRFMGSFYFCSGSKIYYKVIFSP